MTQTRNLLTIREDLRRGAEQRQRWIRAIEQRALDVASRTTPTQLRIAEDALIAEAHAEALSER